MEKATGPDRELDCEIAVSVDWRWDEHEDDEPTARGMFERHGLSWLVERTRGSIWRAIPDYTASLDEAMTLAGTNEAFAFLIQTLDAIRIRYPEAWYLSNDQQRQIVARFFTAACLRARAATMVGGEG